MGKCRFDVYIYGPMHRLRGNLVEVVRQYKNKLGRGQGERKSGEIQEGKRKRALPLYIFNMDFDLTIMRIMLERGRFRFG